MAANKITLEKNYPVTENHWFYYLYLRLIMRLVTKDDLQRWAPTFYAKGDFPLLISELTRATAPRNAFIQFPSGSSVYIKGWDGIVRCEEGTEFIPKGTSLWEFGTSEDNEAKAQKDYDKRTANPEGENPLTSTFIFATPTVFANKDVWCAARIKEAKWADVRVYDARNIEDWLSLSPVVTTKFAKQIGLKYNGVFLTEVFWEEWTTGPNRLKLHPSCVTAGREKQSQELLKYLLSNPDNILAVRAPSKDEAIAFIIASALQFLQDHQDYFFSKSLIAETADDFRLARENKTGLNIISKMEERGSILHTGISKGHHVLVPLGPYDEYSSQDIITLPTLEKKLLESGLVKMGIQEEEASNYARESGGNLTILKRLLKFEYKIDWLKKDNIREVIPAMLLGRWDENKQGDVEILENLSGEKYSEYITKIIKWRDSDTSIFLQIGSTWRLTSPMDSWTNLCSLLIKDDFEKLRNNFLTVLSNSNPALDVEPEQRYMASILGKESTYSTWAREGLTQSLILIGLYGKNLKISAIDSPQGWVDGIIRELLSTTEGKLWASLNYEMPLIAEASPTSFMEGVEISLSKKESPILEMFAQEASIISSTSRHTGLLWALEELAWVPDYLPRASLILARLSAIDPGGNLSNRPINSLTELFKPWHCQTLASFEERIDVLKLIAKKEKEVAWILLNRLLPKGGNEVGHNSYKMRWRMFGQSFLKSYTYQEIYATHSAVVDIVLSIFDFTEKQLAEIIRNSTYLSFNDGSKVLDFVKKNYDKVTPVTHEPWNTLREILHFQHSYPDSEISLPKEVLERYTNLYYEKEPKDTFAKLSWLFDEHWPRFPEGYDHNKTPSEQQYDYINKRRIEAVTELYSKYGIEKIKEISFLVKGPSWYGDALAHILTKEEDIVSVCEFLNPEKKNLNFISGFLFRKGVLNGIEYLLNLYRQLLITQKFANNTLANLFIPVNPSMSLWKAIESISNEEIENEYWLRINPNFHNLSIEEKTYGINKLTEHKRYYAAIQSCLYSLKDIETGKIIELLEKLAIEKTDENFNINGHEIGLMFEELDKRKDISTHTLLNLELYYVNILASYGTLREPKLLHEELAKNPDLFIDLLTWLYRPKDEKLLELERESLTEEQINNRAKRSFELLNSWKKIPGTNERNKLDENILRAWITKAREKAKERSRLEVADMNIGKILALYPEGDKDWPVEIIYSIIEEINTEEIKRNFSAELFNKRGSSTRMPYDGGNIERAHSKYFTGLAERIKNKFPIVSTIFINLAKGYEEDAKRMDERAERDKLDY
ncbi:MAG: hypothetical protein ACK50A_02250 [Sphingobacteriaceae bacterium]